jgi:antitoxin VapB
MAQSTVFTNNRSQAVRLPAEARFPESVKKVEVRVVGASRVITPVGSEWDSFFAQPPLLDFPERAEDPPPEEREALDF